ncbi:putative quinol monooxygenase [Demequina activiva]|uniref:Antibiotic biosynthesis monooxygenase n=1 Tax=Demequina activiva TaxID=1582364 RepID=A0A919Q5W2_9MICO|nr:antibiotic biosynthesis monooxygenase [Demequina activiva]GIG54395.1 antibiotic biosynthesis monooxygenase [Demequina activiva]
MYGLIGAIRATAGDRDTLMAALASRSVGMPGNEVYLIAADANDPDLVWVTESWRSREAHQASLSLPAVREAIARARPVIAGFDSQVETVPLPAPETPGTQRI